MSFRFVAFALADGRPGYYIYSCREGEAQALVSRKLAENRTAENMAGPHRPWKLVEVSRSTYATGGLAKRAGKTKYWPGYHRAEATTAAVDAAKVEKLRDMLGLGADDKITELVSVPAPPTAWRCDADGAVACEPCAFADPIRPFTNVGHTTAPINTCSICGVEIFELTVAEG